jgi:hypothetical protein
MINFFKQEPTLSDLDFDNQASAVNMLVNILATATAYNGVYAQFGYHESFLSTSTLLSSIVGIASNSSVLLETKNSAKSTRSVSVGSSDLEAFTPFSAIATDGSSVLFFNTKKVTANTSSSIDLYCGTQVLQLTTWNYKTNSIVVPLSVDPRTIEMYVVNSSGVQTTWTRVSKSSLGTSYNNTYFTVLNTVNGYLVTANLPESTVPTTSDTVYIRAVVSNGTIGNSANINTLNNVTYLTTSTPDGGYNSLSVDLARAKTQFAASAQHKCVTLSDYKYAILASNISGTTDETLITVSNGSAPGIVKVYVTGLSTENQNKLITYLGTLAVAGVNVVYSL